MAQAEQLSRIFGKLEATYSGSSAGSTRTSPRTQSSRALTRQLLQQHTRINQFEVQSRLGGLVEKFFILGRNDLASDLQVKVQEVELTSLKCLPDILHLLLELSDKPAEKVSPDDLPRAGTPPPQDRVITWEAILTEEPLSDPELWQDVTFSAASDDEDVVSDFASTGDEDAGLPSANTTETFDVDALIVPVDESLLNTLELTTSRTTSANSLEVTEHQVCREALSMLRGLPTSLFAIHSYGSVTMITAEQIAKSASLSPTSWADVLERFAAFGSSCFRIRTWLHKTYKDTVMQRLQHAVSELVLRFDDALQNTERRVLRPQRSKSSVTIMQLEATIEPFEAMLSRLDAIITEIYHQSDPPLACLNLLYEEVILAQMVTGTSIMTAWLALFDAALQAYLHPLSKWMLYGEMFSASSSFPVTELPTEYSSDPYSRRFGLQTNADGSLTAPKFITRGMAEQVLETGNDAIMSQALGIDASNVGLQLPIGAVLELIKSAEAHEDLPFSELLSSSLQQWLQSCSNPIASSIVQSLWRECLLAQQLDILEYLYFSKDGSVLQQFSDMIFQKADNDKRRAKGGGAWAWDHSILLTEIARKAFGGNKLLKSNSLTIRREQSKAAITNKTSISPIPAIGAIALHYRLPWTLRLVVESQQVHQQVFKLLLCICRAKYLFKRDYANFRSQSIDSGAIGLRQRLLWFVDMFHAYVVDTVLAAEIEKLRLKLLHCINVRELRNDYAAFLQRIQELCLLDRRVKPILDAVMSIFEVAELFAATQQLQRKEAPSYPHKRRLHDQADSGSDSDGESFHDTPHEGDGDYDADTETIRRDNMKDVSPVQSKTPTARRQLEARPYDEQIVYLTREFSQHANFILSGLRGVSRATGSEVAGLEILAERLEWGMIGRS